MNAISWNCRGLGNSRAVRALRDVIKSLRPNIVFLMETLSKTERIKHLCSKLGFDNYWAVDCVGRSGGVAMLWKNNVKCNVVGFGSNYIDAQVMNANDVLWRLTGFYGFPERTRRRESWELLKSIANRSVLPWVVVGDFNDMISMNDKKGTHAHPPALLDGFKQTIEDYRLIELDLMGGKYTWEKCRGKPEWVRERLDRAFATTSWWSLFPLCKLNVHHCVHSDHEPIQLEFYSTEHSRKKFRFRFENIWLKEENFHEEVSAHWRNLNPSHFLSKLVEISSFMEKWGKRFFNKFREKIRKQKELVALFEDCADATRTSRYFEEKKILEDLLLSEELYWQQRAKSFWLQDGDSNSKFFHAYATGRRKKNQIDKLKNENGEVVTK
ncbi:uncharacterized protein LOC141700659 [Apium graveolens]|uniref:uncharacterized protein LOC141700659 n=1 Tax=Apium graveolens TaxID=4045 RepID=UPI003D79F8BB